METALLLARCGLALVFAVAAAGKLADRGGSRQAARDFGMSERVATPAATLLPLVELGIAVGLVPAGTAQAAAAAASALLVVFAGAIGVSLVRGRRPDCHCFGRLHSAPVGGWALGRNVALAAIAVLVVLQPAVRPTWTELGAGGIALLVAGQAVLAVQLLRRYGRALRRIEELELELIGPALLEVGVEAPPFVLSDLGGRSVSLETLLAKQRPIVLLFTDPGCGACDLVLREAADRDGAPVVVISGGDPDDVAAKVSPYALETVLLDERHEVSLLYETAAVPTAVLIDADGRVASDPAVGAPEVGELLRTATTSYEPQARRPRTPDVVA
jgi:peroxiredoxin